MVKPKLKKKKKFTWKDETAMDYETDTGSGTSTYDTKKYSMTDKVTTKNGINYAVVLGNRGGRVVMSPIRTAGMVRSVRIKDTPNYV